MKFLGDDKHGKIELQTSIDMVNILDLDESHSKMTLKMIVTVEWVEPRIKFLHLKSDENRNILTVKEMSQLWMPAIIFTNTKHSLELDFNKGSGFATVAANNGN